MTPTATPVPETTAVVVTCGATGYLRRTLKGVARQTHVPTRVVVVDIWASGRDLGTGGSIQALIAEIGLDLRCRVRVVQAPEARTFGEAVRRGLELNMAAQQRADKLHETRTGAIPVITADTSPGWLWLLHDDSAPAPTCLAALLRTAESGPSIALAGAKQRGWEDPTRLLEVGIHATRSARRLDPIDADEIDQGQYDAIEDVLAVGTAGALVRRDVWNALGGLDPALGPFGDGLEFSRRVRLAGYRVVVVPAAVVHHAQASHHGLRGYGHAAPAERTPDLSRSFGARRRAQLYNWILAVPWYQLFPLLLWVLVLTPLRALARFAAKDLARARAELSAGTAVLSRPDLWMAARRRLRRTSTRPSSALAALEANPRELARQKREQRRTRAEARRLLGLPSELEINERAALRRRRRATAAGIAAGTLAVALLGQRQLLGVGALAGGALLPGHVRLRELAAVAFSWWIPAGDGLPGPADPFFAVMLLPLLTGVSLSAVTTVLILLAIPLAALAAWFAAGAATRSLALRSGAALLWGFAPALVVAAGQGRVGSVLAHVLLPLVLLLTARAMGIARRDVILSGMVGAQRVVAAPAADGTGAARPAEVRPSLGAAGGAALAFAGLAAGAPVLLPVGVLGYALLILGSRARHVLWFIPLPALVLFGPLLTAVVREGNWHALLASPGVPTPYQPAAPWVTLLGVPLAADGVPQWLWWGALVPGAVVVLLAAVALLRGRPSALAVRAGWLLAVAGLALALAAPRVAVGLDAAGGVVAAWPGAGLSLLSAGLLTAALAGGDGVREQLGGRPLGWRQFGAGLLGALAVTAALVAPAVWLLGQHGAGTHLVGAARTDPLPALAEQLAAGPERARTLALDALPDGTITADLWRGQGEQLQHTSTLAAARAVHPLSWRVGPVGDQADQALAGIVGAMAAGTASGTGPALAAHAVGVVLVPPLTDPGATAARDALVAALDATPGLARVTENASGVVWRVATDGREAAAVTVGRAQVHAGGTAVGELPAGLVSARGTLPDGPAGRQLVLAERVDPDWVARLDGIPLVPEQREWQQAFRLPAGGGELTLAHEPPQRSLWLAAQALVFLTVAVLALPVRRRRED